MELKWIDIAIFLGFIGFVLGISLFKSRKEKTGEDYFLASRSLLWWLIGFSLIAANISTEQFIGMNGLAAGNVGMAVASYDWMAAISMVFVAIFFLPRFLKSGIYTIPEYLEYRYNSTARMIMAIYTMVIYVTVTVAAVIYAGALTLQTIFGMDLTQAVWLIGLAAVCYTAYGGLKAVVWADLIQGSSLIIGGIIVTVYGFIAVGGVPAFFEANEDRLHMILPADHPVLPWTALVLGLWIPHFYYWGLNQYIMQRNLGAKSLKHGQLGILFAAAIQVVLPLIIVIPGLMALQLYGDQLAGNSDTAFPLLIKNLVPTGFKGFIMAALFGAIVSSLSSMLNAASAIFTMDIYKRHWKQDAAPKSIITIGRLMTVLFAVIGCLIAPQLGNPRFQGIFNYIQEFQGFISPGILAAFVFGLIFKRAPAAAGVASLILNIPVYGILLKYFSNIAFLNRMAITFIILLLTMAVITIIKPLDQPKVLPATGDVDIKPSPLVNWLGAAIIAVTVALYIIFW